MKRDQGKIGNIGVVAVLVVVGIVTVGAIGLLFFDSKTDLRDAWMSDKSTLEKTLMLVQAEKAAMQTEIKLMQERSPKIGNTSFEEKRALENEIAMLKDKLAEIESNTFFSDTIREKAELEVQVNQFKSMMDEKEREVAELKQQNQNLVSKINVNGESEGLLKRQLEEKESVNKLLSQYLADEKQRNKDIANRLAALKTEKESISKQLDQLVSEKEYAQRKLQEIAMDLESNQKEKKLLTAKLESVQQVISERLGEIVRVKQDLDSTLQDTKTYVQNQIEEIELEPIVVRSEVKTAPVTVASAASNETRQIREEIPVQVAAVNTAKELVGKVLVVNENLNFIVIDKGANQGVAVGMKFKVMDSKGVIADTKVIEVRDNIAAADIQLLNSSQTIQEGDFVKIALGS